MDLLLLLLAIPLIIPFAAKIFLNYTITWKEVGLHVVVVLIAVTACWGISNHSKTADVEILNGQVTDKARKKVSCSHSYSCNCVTVYSGTGPNRSSSQVCQTCYDHSYDVDWVVKSTVGDFRIRRINRQGTKEPPRWTVVKPKQPVAREHTFTNYIKAVPDLLFEEADTLSAEYAGKLPPYPGNVYDYHYVNRVLTSGVKLPDQKEWNQELALLLRSLGPAKRVNIIIVFSNAPSMKYSLALSQSWLGGKKNDVVVVMGTPSYPAIEWVNVFSWSDSELFKVQLRDELFNHKTVDRAQVLKSIATHTSSSFVRKPMKDFEYLKSSIRPSTTVLMIIELISIMLSIGLSVWFHRERVI